MHLWSVEWLNYDGRWLLRSGKGIRYLLNTSDTFLFRFSFSQQQSRNCDGGVQELSAAAKCIRDVFPDCEIVPERTNAYPLKVVIAVESPGEGEKVIVWSGKQQNLFEKYQNKRSKCMQRIKSKLTGLREQQQCAMAVAVV